MVNKMYIADISTHITLLERGHYRYLDTLYGYKTNWWDQIIGYGIFDKHFVRLMPRNTQHLVI